MMACLSLNDCLHGFTELSMTTNLWTNTLLQKWIGFDESNVNRECLMLFNVEKKNAQFRCLHSNILMCHMPHILVMDFVTGMKTLESWGCVEEGNKSHGLAVQGDPTIHEIPLAIASTLHHFYDMPLICFGKCVPFVVQCLHRLMRAILKCIQLLFCNPSHALNASHFFFKSKLEYTIELCETVPLTRLKY